MIENKKVLSFVRSSNHELREFCQKNECHFNYPSESAIVERIMRLGVEARALHATTIDELRDVAVATIQNDFMQHWQSPEQQAQRKNHLLELMSARR